MPISVSCACGHQFRAKDRYAGKTVKCSKCGKNVVIAGPSVAAYDVFLSYSSKDKPTADAACAALEARGLRCWVAPRDIIPGKEWGAAVVEGIEQSRSMVLVFSANANTSGQVMREVERAVHREMPIIPFRIEDVPASKNMEYFISCHHWMDAFDGSLDDHLAQLAQTVRSLLAGGPASQPAAAKPSRVTAPPRATARRPDAPAPRRSPAPALLLVLALLIVGGGAAGFYVWTKRATPKNEKGQETETVKQIALRGSTEPSGTGKEPFGTGKEQSGTGKDQQPPRVNGPVAPENSLPTFREDFSKAKEGELPKGWDGPAAVSVRKGGDRPHLAVTDPGQHDITLPAFALPKDFFLECDFHLGLGPYLELTLEGKDGGRDLALKANASSGRSTGVAALLAVGLADLDAKENTKSADPEGQFRLRLEREEEVLRVKVNGETVHARPVRGYKGFARVRLALPGGAGTKLYSIAMGQLPDRPASADPVFDGATAFQKGYVEDFRATEEGRLPKGWEGDDAINVMKMGGRARLEVSAKGLHPLTLPPLVIRGNFFCECDFQLLLGPRLELTLQGKDAGRDLTLRANASAGNSTGVAALLEVGLADLDAKESTKAADPEGQFRLRLEREGEIFRVKVNGETVVTRRMADYGDFTGVRLGLPGEGEVRFYAIRIGPLSGSK